ncbi:MAG: nucleotidyltransferase domain-containing protein [Candidatus Hermodarchaeota archaeon]
MSREKILREYHKDVIYTESDWALLKSKRKRAIELLELFREFKPYTYGSIARGNVHKGSDIDLIFTRPISTFKIELVLQNNGYNHYFREIIMATPKDSIKLYIHLSELESLTIPITKLDKIGLEFYDFGGKITLEQLRSEARVPGIDKRLILILPNSNGHEELSIINNESFAAKQVGVSIDTIMERKKVLLKRERYGRTGVFLKREIDINESVEEVLKDLANKKPIIRKKLFIK